MPLHMHCIVYTIFFVEAKYMIKTKASPTATRTGAPCDESARAMVLSVEFVQTLRIVASPTAGIWRCGAGLASGLTALP